MIAKLQDRISANLTFWVTIGLVLTFVLGACGMPEGPAADPGQDGEVSEDEVSMALILIGEVTDLSWNAQMYEAGQQIEEELGIEVASSEQVADSDVERVLREYADSGYDLIVAHSFSYGDATFRVAEEYPDTNFAWAGGIDRTAENVADYDQPFYEAAYLVGIIAGHTTETNVINNLGGFDIPVCHSMAEAFRAGAERVNPDVELLTTYVGDWGDVGKAKEAALAQIESGADFAIGCGEGPTLGAIEAAKEQGVYATGYVGEMSEIAPDAVATSIVWNLVPLLTEMVEDTRAGTFQPGKYYSLGVAEGGLDVVVNPELEDQIPQEALDEVEQVRAEIANGEFEVPYVPE